MLRVSSILAFMPLVLGLSVFGDEITLQRVPGAVIASARKAVPGAKLVSAERKNEDDQVELTYRITLDRKGMKTTVEAWPTGEIVKIEKQITPKELPRAVTKFLSAKYPKAKIRSTVLVSDMSKDRPLYNLGITFEEIDYQIQVAADGTVDQSDKKFDVAKLPKPVKDVVSGTHPNAKIQGVVERTVERKVSYVLDVSLDDKHVFKMHIEPDGFVLEDERANAAQPCSF